LNKIPGCKPNKMLSRPHLGKNLFHICRISQSPRMFRTNQKDNSNTLTPKKRPDMYPLGKACRNFLRFRLERTPANMLDKKLEHLNQNWIDTYRSSKVCTENLANMYPQDKKWQVALPRRRRKW
jgi:hypothetical protein